MNDIERLIQLLARLPGLGPRSARRVALHLINKRESLMQPLATALAEAAENIRTCSSCGSGGQQQPSAGIADVAERHEGRRGRASAHHRAPGWACAEADGGPRVGSGG